ncbi:hypothetical protein GN244_ATG12570 [Phytophthora infestans]|uniref:Uncharacterized protein n=1 Tax=Phytophthora infestans TaxID=4787 RepID=A0A833SYN2_PHYIN|nr:hypothetical protein GN244_ATG12570 [Phytophthora infestans]
MDMDVTETCYNIESALAKTDVQPPSTATTPEPAPDKLPNGATRLVRALADFGSSRSLCAPNIISDERQLSRFTTKWMAKGGRFETIGTAPLYFKLPAFTTNRVVQHNFYVTAPGAEKHGYEFIISRDLILALAEF